MALRGDIVTTKIDSDQGTGADLSVLEMLDREELIKIIRTLSGPGVTVSFHGKRTAREISRRVRPRVTRRVPDWSTGTPEEQANNILIEGENLQAMVTLYKYRGQVDLILTDPPYNTGKDFRYNDKWDTDPNDPDLGSLVTLEDGSRHTKWMKVMYPRLHMMKSMLKPNGVLAICIDDNEFCHLGMMLDEVFGEQNRIAIINWQKNYSPKNDSKHVSTATEYVLVYARDKEKVVTRPLERSESMNKRFSNPDNDPNGDWADADLSGGQHSKPEDFGIQSPFTGVMHYPAHRWRMPKTWFKKNLEQWGSQYVSIADPNATLPSLVLKGTKLVDGVLVTPPEIVAAARERAMARRDAQVWPELIFLSNGDGRPRFKKSLRSIKRGRIPLTYWADEEYDEPTVLGCQSWDHEESGHSQTGVNELDSLMGKGHGFQTVKPLKLFTKILQLWCPPNGLVLDPYAGSGTTGHAVLELNHDVGANRRFILIEQGRPESGDKYARTLTNERIRRAITGARPGADGSLEKTAEPLGGGFEFRILTSQIDAGAVLSMRRDDLVDVVITSHWDVDRRSGPSLIRIDDPGFRYLVGKNELGEGYFIVWDGEGPVGQLDVDTYKLVLAEGKKAGLKPPYHVYARYEVYQSQHVRFYKIPEEVLAHLGLGENEAFNDESEGAE